MERWLMNLQLSVRITFGAECRPPCMMAVLSEVRLQEKEGVERKQFSEGEGGLGNSRCRILKFRYLFKG